MSSKNLSKQNKRKIKSVEVEPFFTHPEIRKYTQLVQSELNDLHEPIKIKKIRTRFDPAQQSVEIRSQKATCMKSNSSNIKSNSQSNSNPIVLKDKTLFIDTSDINLNQIDNIQINFNRNSTNTELNCETTQLSENRHNCQCKSKQDSSNKSPKSFKSQKSPVEDSKLKKLATAALTKMRSAATDAITTTYPDLNYYDKFDKQKLKPIPEFPIIHGLW